MRSVIAFLPGLILAFALAGCDRQKAEAPQGGAPVEAPGPSAEPGRLDRSNQGAPAPDIAFQGPQGESLTLADFGGRPVLVNLWATWCAPCIVEMPSLDALAAREDDALRVLALSQDLGGWPKVRAFFRERNFSELEPYLDSDMRFMTALGIEILPTTILYDAEGREVWRMTGIADWEGEAARRILAEAS